MPEEKFELTIQQEADLDQAANAWVNDLIEKKLIDPFKFASIAGVIGEAMKGACLEQIKELNYANKIIAEARVEYEKLSADYQPLLEQGKKLMKHAESLTSHLTLANKVADEAARSLDLMSRQTCECVGYIDTDGTPVMEHKTGCSAGIALSTLLAIKILMEPLIDGA